MVALLKAWWNAPDNYEWTMAYLASRSASVAARILIGFCAVAMGLMGPFVLVLPYAPSSSSGTVLVWMLAAGAAGFGVLWWTTDVDRAGSVMFLLYADVSTTVVCSQLSDPVYAMFASTALIVGGSYATFFHGSKVLVAHVLWSAGTVAVLAYRIAHAPDAGPLVAAAAVSLAGVTNVAVPLFAQFGYWALRVDAAGSFTDPLTGLLNRRGIHARVTELINRGACDSDDVVVFAIDLDRFKEINDNHGHSVGDDVLVRTARRIMSEIGNSALLARMGGEEFLVVERMPRAEAPRVAERIRLAIAAPGERVATTASIGVASRRIDEFDSARTDPTAMFDRLVDTADSAMYRAKDAGRNTVIVAVGPQAPLPPDQRRSAEPPL